MGFQGPPEHVCTLNALDLYFTTSGRETYFRAVLCDSGTGYDQDGNLIGQTEFKSQVPVLLDTSMTDGKLIYSIEFDTAEGTAGGSNDVRQSFAERTFGPCSTSSAPFRTVS